MPTLALLLLPPAASSLGCANKRRDDEVCTADFLPCTGAEGEGRCLLGACQPLSGARGAGLAFPVPDTRLLTCMGSSALGTEGEIDCPGEAGGEACANTPGCGQDAQYGWDASHPGEPRFRVEGGDEPVVQDRITGLRWQRCALGQAGPDCQGTATLLDGWDAAAACEASTWGGHTDWVLPSAKALMASADYGRTGPAFDEEVFPNSPGDFPEVYDAWWIDCLWSGTDYAGQADVAWALMVNSGDVSQGSGLDYHLHDRDAEGWEGCFARCVRAEPTPSHGRFLRLEPVAGEAVVADLVGERLWTACAVGQAGADCAGEALQLDWLSALVACEGLSWGGLSDWRLPDIQELRSLVDESRISPAIDEELFPNTPYYGPSTTLNVGNFWSSTARSYNDFALYVDFGTGFSHFYVQSEQRHVRCVR